ncbi:MAG: GH92 family glycosyl hydrolase [Saprospiraceae bacterium]|nr:GH92 family glycosyl hydrolase [Saprospiraceae bacterium]
MILRSALLAIILLYFGNCYGQKKPAQYVNTFIGTGGHGHTYPGATVPYGMVQLSPDTRIEGWDGCGGYHYDDNYIYGFSHTHLNGTGVPDLCDILVMPGTGETVWNNGFKSKPGYGSSFSHSGEKSSPGYYSVTLQDYNIKAELTATKRVGLHRYSFPKSDKAKILFDLQHRDEVLESSIKVVSNTRIEGLRRSRSWAQDQYIYFVAEFSKPFSSYKIAVNDQEVPDIAHRENEKNIKAEFNFTTSDNEKILVKVGISAVSIEGASLNLKNELPHWDFERVKMDADKAWHKELSRIQVDGGSEDKKVIFYTALYHAMINPNIFMDVDGKYRGRDLEIHQAKGFDNYTIFSLWDVYRTWFPLMSIIDRKRYLDYIQTFLVQYEQGGHLPVWELHGNETNCMIGYHAIPPMVDGYVKGIKGFDTQKALEAMKKSAIRPDHTGLAALDKKGFVSLEDEVESASKTLEYAYDDWAIAMFAKSLGKMDDYEYFIKRGQNYKNLFDFSSGFMRARSNGGWFNPFDPFEVNFNYTEANSWQYSFSAVQDITGFIQLHGGKQNVAKKLDELFSVNSAISGRHQSDITGLIGQYAHGNEPSHHMAYLYPFVGQSWKTQQRVHQIMKEMYTIKPDGLSGNEDCGQMSAWLIMSAMGFYPVTPGTDDYVIGTPWFEKVTINLENGKKFIINAKNISDQNYYISSAMMNGKRYDKSYIKHQQIMNGGNLSFSLSSTPNKNWGNGQGNEPVTSIAEHLIVPSPSVKEASKSFRGSKSIELIAQPNAKVFYRVGEGKTFGEYVQYTTPFEINATCTIDYYALADGLKSNVITSEFVKMPDDKDISLKFVPQNQYSSGGATNLIDGIRCAPDFRINGWLGFEKNNLEAIIDLRSKKEVSEFGVGFIQDNNAWVFYPAKIEFFASDDGSNYTKIGEVVNVISPYKEGVMLQMFELPETKVSARYVKVIGHNIGHCPPGHKGLGAPAWLFSDEIIIK